MLFSFAFLTLLSIHGLWELRQNIVVFLKQIAHHSSCFKYISFTLARKHQLMIASDLHCFDHRTVVVTSHQYQLMCCKVTLKLLLLLSMGSYLMTTGQFPIQWEACIWLLWSKIKNIYFNQILTDPLNDEGKLHSLSNFVGILVPAYDLRKFFCG